MEEGAKALLGWPEGLQAGTPPAYTRVNALPVEADLEVAGRASARKRVSGLSFHFSGLATRQHG